jgi:hypothetical protein
MWVQFPPEFYVFLILMPDQLSIKQAAINCLVSIESISKVIQHRTWISNSRVMVGNYMYTVLSSQIIFL